jgi:carbamoyl-phosphate synthase large subunit
MTINVLVMSAGSIPGVAVINALRGQSEITVRIIAADMGDLSAGFLLADAWHLVPAASAPDFILTIHDICRKESVHVVFPIIDEELQVFADHAGGFWRDGIRVITNSPETVRLAKDKVLTARRCTELGVATPPVVLSEDLATVSLPPFPLILKPRGGRGSVDVHKVKNRRELEFFLDYVDNPMIQQFIEGTEYTIDVLTDFDGRLLSLVPKERMMVKSGMQTKGRTVNDPDLVEYAARVVHGFRLFPRGNIQCIRDQTGKIWLIEVNPKFPASLPFTIAAGVNAPLLLLKMHTGQQVPPMLGQFTEGLIMLRIWRELYTHL